MIGREPKWEPARVAKAEAASVPGVLIGNLVVSGNTSCAYGEATQDATTIYFQFGVGTISGPLYRVAK